MSSNKFNKANLIDLLTSTLANSHKTMIQSQKSLDDLDCVMSISEGLEEDVKYISSRISDSTCSLLLPSEESLSLKTDGQVLHLLLLLLRKSTPKELQLQGISIQNVDNKYSFCITGSFTSEALQSLLELSRESITI